MILICTNPRSGSSHLAELLGTMLGGLPAGEFLNPDWDFPFGENKMSLENRITILEAMERRGEAVVLKIIYRDFANARKEGIDLFARFPKAPVIFLRRRNKARQAISLIKAIQSHDWHLRQEHRLGTLSYDPQRLVYDPLLLAWYVQAMEEGDQSWHQEFAKLRRPILELDYETITAQREATVQQIAGFLGLPEGSGQEKSTFHPIADHINQDWETWYDLFQKGKTDPCSHQEGLWLDLLAVSPDGRSATIQVRCFGEREVTTVLQRNGVDMPLVVGLLDASVEVPGKRFLRCFEPLPPQLSPGDEYTFRLRVPDDVQAEGMVRYAMILRQAATLLRVLGPNTPVVRSQSG